VEDCRSTPVLYVAGKSAMSVAVGKGGGDSVSPPVAMLLNLDDAPLVMPSS